jgi:hypothetical protein
MVQIAISLGVIGIALVAIIGVLPLGMRVQRDNREQTVVNQDATVFMEAVRKGALGLDDLTNYVYAITNAWVLYNPDGTVNKQGVDGYNYQGSQITKVSSAPIYPINSGRRIVGLLSTPEYTDINGAPIVNLFNGGYSNHVVAYVRSLSGPAVEKPPQANDSIIREDSFTYRMLSVNAPFSMNTPPLWQSQIYQPGNKVLYLTNGVETFWQWQANTNSIPTDAPGQSRFWVRDRYTEAIAESSHELRLAFFWPQLPNGRLGLGRQTYRTMVAGQIIQTNDNSQMLYYFQSQSFTNAP